VDSAKQTLAEINPHVEIVAVNAFLTESALFELCQQVDLVIDCTDNGLSRALINQVAMQAKKPLVSAAAIRWEGQVTVFDGREVNTPCYHCFDPLAIEGGETCDAQGIVAPVVGAIGLLQALEAVKVLLGRPSLIGEVLLFDGLTMTHRKMRLTQDPDCPVCQARRQAESVE
jgi:adenylyltransferase/sulfurtransferase